MVRLRWCIKGNAQEVGNENIPESGLILKIQALKGDPVREAAKVLWV